jgi:bacillopeptidase F
MFQRIRTFSLLIAPFLIFLAALTSQAGVLSPELQSLLPSLTDQDEISVIITLSDRVDIHLIRDKSKPARRSKIIKALKSKADSTQKPLKEFLRAKGVGRVTSLWVINGIAATLSVEVLREVERRPEVEEIKLDASFKAPSLTFGGPVLPEWNILAVQAPDLWNLGFRGEGIVIANMDTGVDPDHPDLKDKWRGGTNSWFDPNEEHKIPYDAHGHGTQTMGLMVGGNAGGTAIGVAPAAKWIGVKIFNDLGNASLSAIHQGFQWLLDPDHDPDTDDAPDVVNHSWDLGNVNGCSLEFQTDLQVLKAAGISLVFAAGNSGSNPSTSSSPANNPEGFSVGAVDESFLIAPSSSRGPSACDESTYPKVVGPGVNVKTSDLTFGGVFPDSYAFVSGTSFSAPHISGTMALLLSALPGATVEMVESALKQSALDLGASGPDNVYGYGFVDALHAYLQGYRSLFGPSIQDLLFQYYQGAFGRAPDPGGFDWWAGEIDRMVALGIDIKEVFMTIGKVFFDSPEYFQLARTDADYIIDLYETYLNRTPAQGEVDFWWRYMEQGASRDLVKNWFAYSEEFRLRLEDMFGKAATRPENNLVNDFYRGFLARLPDTDGFNFWVSLIRDAQCATPQNIEDLSFQIALGFTQSPEYASKNRGNREYVEDLYESILHRSAGPVDEIGYWMDLLNSSLLNREQTLRFFTGSAEFQIRLQKIVDAGCLS